MNRSNRPAQELEPETGFDDIDIEIIRHRLIAVPNLIEKNIERTAFSLLVQEYKDYAVGYTDALGRLVTQSRYSLPAFVANALGLGVREGLRVLGERNLHSGDIVLVNGHALGKHLNDVVAYTPVRVSGELVGFFAVLVHWIDLGGTVVGSCFSPTATDVWQEGVQYPTVKIISKGERSAEMMRLIAANTRFPSQLIGDLEAQIGGCKMGHDLVQEIISDHGRPAFDATVEAMFADAEANAERTLRAVPEGTYTASSFLDDDGVRRNDPLKIDVKVTIADGTMTVDLSKLSKQAAGPVNQSRDGGALAHARLAYKYLFAPDTPVNEGDFSRIRLVVPDGTFASAGPEAAVGAGGYTGNTVLETLLTALAPAMPDRVPAAHHGIYGIHTLTGRNPSTTESWMCLDAVSGGWGAWRDRDGPNALRSMVHGDVRDVPVEIQEALYPYRITAKRLRQDSGGAGRQRGGLGVEKTYSFPKGLPITLNVNIDRTGCPPWGLDGGGAGRIAEAMILHADGSKEMLKKENRQLAPSDQFIMRSGGGGGVGCAFEREIRAVLADVELGYVSREGALRDYGVVIGEDGVVDEAATRAIRAESGNAAIRSSEWP